MRCEKPLFFHKFIRYFKKCKYVHWKIIKHTSQDLSTIKFVPTKFKMALPRIGKILPLPLRKTHFPFNYLHEISISIFELSRFLYNNLDTAKWYCWENKLLINCKSVQLLTVSELVKSICIDVFRIFIVEITFYRL